MKLYAAVESLRRQVPVAAVAGRDAEFADAEQVGRPCAELAGVDILASNGGCSS